MKLHKFQAKVQDFFKISQSELYFSLVILAASFVFAAYSIAVNSDRTKSAKENFAKINKIIDSLATIEQSSYIGSDSNQIPMSELVAGDTLAKKPLFQVKAKLKTGEKININTAGMKDLTKLPGIGESSAQNIIDERNRNKFDKIEDIKRVKGIGDKKFEKLKEFIIIK